MFCRHCKHLSEQKDRSIESRKQKSIVARRHWFQHSLLHRQLLYFNVIQAAMQAVSSGLFEFLWHRLGAGSMLCGAVRVQFSASHMQELEHTSTTLAAMDTANERLAQTRDELQTQR